MLKKRQAVHRSGFVRYLRGILGHRPKLAQIGRIQVDNSQHQTLMS
jgi:hypothetical protein